MTFQCQYGTCSLCRSNFIQFELFKQHGVANEIPAKSEAEIDISLAGLVKFS